MRKDLQCNCRILRTNSWGKHELKLPTKTIKKPTPLGVKLETNGEGSLTGSHQNAMIIETINIFQKTDATFEWEDKAIITIVGGETIFTAGRGSGKATGPTTFLGLGGVGAAIAYNNGWYYYNDMYNSGYHNIDRTSVNSGGAFTQHWLTSQGT